MASNPLDFGCDLVEEIKKKHHQDQFFVGHPILSPLSLDDQLPLNILGSFWPTKTMFRASSGWIKRLLSQAQHQPLKTMLLGVNLPKQKGPSSSMFSFANHHDVDKNDHRLFVEVDLERPWFQMPPLFLVQLHSHCTMAIMYWGERFHCSNIHTDNLHCLNLSEILDVHLTMNTA